METYSIVIFAAITVFSFVLFLVSLLSYWKYGKGKLLLIAAVFFVFLLRALLLSASLFSEDVSSFISSTHIWLFDLVILALLYITSLKR